MARKGRKTMILQLDDKHRIVSDEHNFILQKKMKPRKNNKAKKDIESWKNIGYWKDLPQLLASYTRRVLKGKTGKTSLTALSRDLRSLRQAIDGIGTQCVTLWGKN